MFKLIKMDFYRLFSSKAIKVGALMACVATAGYMLLSLGIIAIAEFALKEDPATAANMGALMSQVAWMNGATMDQIIFKGTGAFSLFIGCMIAANFIGSEQSCGYTKNFAGQLPNRGYMVISKFITTSFVQLMILLIYVITSGIFGQIFLGKYITGAGDMGLLFGALGLRLLLHLGMNAVIIFICTLTKSHAIAMVVGCIFGLNVTSVVYMAAAMLSNALKIEFTLGDYMPDGINIDLGLSTVNDLWIKAIVVSIVFMVVFVGANYFLTKKRDVK